MLGIMTLSGCGTYYKVQKADHEYRYEEAKACFVRGQYGPAAELLTDLLLTLKNTQYGEESLYMLAMSEFCHRDYESAAGYFKKYYQTYPKGLYVEHSRYYYGVALYYNTNDPRLDQSSTWEAITAFQDFLDYYPYTKLKPQTQEMIYALQDKLVEKELRSAKLYYDLGTYVMNSTMGGGSNYEACIVTAQNALKDFPYATPERKEELSMMILRARYQLAKESVPEKKNERFRNTVDEYFSFVNDYPESKFMAEAKRIHKHSDAYLKDNNVKFDD